MSQNSSLLDFLEMIDLPVFSADNGRTLRINPEPTIKSAGTCTFDQWIRRWTRRIAGIGCIRKKMEPKLAARATDQPQMRQPGRKQTYKKQKIPLATRQRDHFLKGASLKISGV